MEYEKWYTPSFGTIWKKYVPLKLKIMSITCRFLIFDLVVTLYISYKHVRYHFFFEQYFSTSVLLCNKHKKRVLYFLSMMRSRFFIKLAFLLQWNCMFYKKLIVKKMFFIFIGVRAPKRNIQSPLHDIKWNVLWCFKLFAHQKYCLKIIKISAVLCTGWINGVELVIP